MKLHEQLLSKNGLATVKLSKELLKYSIGDRLPTVSEFTETLGLVRGTEQNAMKNLIDSEAIRVESKGHLGSYLVKKNTKMLLNYAGIDSLVGAMPLPYSKRYEGLATGLIASMENKYNIPINLAYMRGAKSRLAMMIQGRYDFAIVSRYAAEEFAKEHDEIEIAVSLGNGSYLSDHVIMFHNSKDTEIKDGMKIGIDSTSLDQRNLCEYVCRGKNVEFVELEYSTILTRVMEGEIDATVMNIDEALDKKIKINYQEIKGGPKTNTEAVIVVSKAESELSYLLRELVDRETVLNVQKLVLEGRITPSY